MMIQQVLDNTSSDKIISLLSKLTIASLIILLFSGCGGGGYSETASDNSDNNNDTEISNDSDSSTNQESSNESNNSEKPLISIDQFQFTGAFTIPKEDFGVSDANYAEAIIEQSGDSLYLVGHVYDDAIAEFKIPEIVKSTNILELNSAGIPIQQFTQVLNRTVDGNPQKVDQIMGMEVYKGRLIVNGDEFYDAPANNTHTTVVLSDASDLAASSVEGFLELPGAARSAGWITQVPPEWQDDLDGDLLVGSATGTAIISRHSVGPSAHALDGNAFLSATADNPTIETQKLLEYSLDNPLNTDLYNESRSNKVWTITSEAKFGFIVPGTRTYAVFGSSSGHESGIGYKITQDNGNLCGGPCSYAATDIYNFYWLYDMDDLMDVKAGNVNNYDVRPYDHGEFEAPFQTDGFNAIGSGSFDLASNTLYLSKKKANNTVGTYSNPPIIATFSINTEN